MDDAVRTMSSTYRSSQAMSLPWLNTNKEVSDTVGVKPIECR